MESELDVFKCTNYSLLSVTFVVYVCTYNKTVKKRNL